MLVRVSIPLRGAASLVRRETSSLSRHGNVLGGGLASPSSLAAFDAWHAALAGAMRPRDDPVATTSDLKAVLRPFVAKDAVFRPPTYFAAWTGREEMLILLESASDVFGPSFTYGRQWLSDDGREWALEFKADIAATGKTIDGIDLISLDEAGRITEFTVLARPPNAVDALKTEMMKRVPLKIAALKAKQAFGMAH